MKPEFEYTVSVEQDDIPVVGNAMDSGDPVEDREVESKILYRLDVGDVWAWAAVTVTCREVHTGVEGTDYLGCCNYRDEKDFRECQYFEDMCTKAYVDCLSQIERVKGLEL